MSNQFTPLWRLARYENGFPFKPDDFGPIGTPVIRIRQLVDPGAKVDLTARHIPARYLLADGDLIFSWSGSLAVRPWDRGPAWLNQHLFKVIPTSGVCQGWLRWIIDASIPRFEGMMHGSAMTHLNLDMLKQIKFEAPSLDEQRRIADFLDAETALIDLLVQQRTRQRDALDELVLSTIDNVVGQMRELPMVRLGYLALVQTGITVDGNRQHDADVVTLPYLRVANVQAGYVDLSDIAEITVSRRAAGASRLRAGDVLMTEGGDLDKLGRGTVWHGEIDGCLHQNHVFAVRPDVDVLIPEYLALLTRAPMARKYFESTGNKTTNLASTSSGKIRDFRIPLTDVGTQRKVVTEIDARVRLISQFEERISRQLALLAERRQALITAAVTGQMDVTTARGVSLPGGVAV